MWADLDLRVYAAPAAPYALKSLENSCLPACIFRFHRQAT